MNALQRAHRNYKPSRYNFFFPDDDEPEAVVAYNSVTNGVVRFSAEQYRYLRPHLESSAPVVPDNALLDGLASQGFLVPEHIDELEAIRRENRRNRGATDAMILTIIPTLSCNFRCDYCFQEHPKAFMSREVEAALLEHVRRRADELRSFTVTWFGGEPLLAVSTIVRLSQGLKDLAKTHDFEFLPTRIVTNGWGLTADNCRRLADCNIGTMQITLDGIEDAHDVRRPLSNGKGTFDRIVANLRNVQKILPHVQMRIRVNVDASNTTALADVKRYFAEHGLSKNITVTAGHVYAYTEHTQTPATTISGERLYQIINKADVEAQKREAEASQISFPSVKAAVFCQAQREHSFVVGPTGALFKCWIEGDMDESRAVGHLLRDEGDKSESERAYSALWNDWDQTRDPECRQCKVLPICGGGCLWQGMQDAGNLNRAAKKCGPYKFGDTLERSVKLRVKARSGSCAAVGSTTSAHSN